MAEILVKAQSITHSDPVKDRRGCYKRGMPVAVMPDGHPWGSEERVPKFVVMKIPLIPVSTVEKYIASWVDATDPQNPVTIQRRRWRIRWVDLPPSVQNTLLSTGELTIKATASYTGAFDFTWAQVKAFFRNEETGLDETVDL